MYIKRLLITLCLAMWTALTSVSYAQDLEFTLQAPKTVEQGQTFGVSFSTNQNINAIKAPDFKGFTVLSGPNVSSSSSVSIIQGQIQRTASYTYSYYLRALKTGSYTIGAASTKYKGKTYNTKPATVKVVKSSSGAQQQNTQQRTQSAKQADVDSKKLFVEVLVDKSTVYLNEPIVATIKLYSQVQVTGSESVNFPSFDGFWSQEIEIPAPSLVNERYNGKIYQTAVFKKLLLYPQKTGSLTIDPTEMAFKVRQRVSRRGGGFFDDFFGNYTNATVKVKSKPKRIRVKALPNKPPEHEGAVGVFKLKSKLSKSKLKTNESLNLTVEISGSGNLKLIDPLSFKFPEDFETYDPKVAENIKIGENGMQGTLKHEYLIIPRHSGTYTIPKQAFVFFNTKTKRFKTLYTKEFTVEVEKGEGEEYSNYQPNSGLQKENIKKFDSDIRYIKTKIGEGLHKTSDPMISKFDYFLYYVMLLAGFFILYFIRRKKIEDNKDLVRVKNKGAKKLVTKRLKKVQVHLKDNNKDLFYNELLAALWGYVGDKFNIPAANVNRDTIADIFAEHQLDAELTQAFLNLADECEFAHFAPSGSSVQDEKNEKYQLAEKLITAIEQKTR